MDSKNTSFLKEWPANKASMAADYETFRAQFASRGSCIDFLFARAQEAGEIRCEYCGATDLAREAGARYGRCRGCSRAIWFTSGTLFDHVKRPEIWLGAIYLLGCGYGLTSNAFSELVGVAQSSALNMLKKLRLVIHSQMGEAAVTVPSNLFLRLFCKRSCETPARAHPSAEETASASQPVHFTDAASTSQKEADIDGSDIGAPADLSEAAKCVLNQLTQEPRSLDALCHSTQIPIGEVSAAMTLLELSGLASFVSGNQYIRTAAAPYAPRMAEEIMDKVNAALAYIKTTFHGISRKASQIYLADYWCAKDRNRWSSGALLAGCLRTAPITDNDILAYISPSMLMFAG